MGNGVLLGRAELGSGGGMSLLEALETERRSFDVTEEAEEKSGGFIDRGKVPDPEVPAEGSEDRGDA